MVAASKLSAKKLKANRLNARKSTGPRTLDGKVRASQNARTHGAFCQDIVLDNEDGVAFAFIRQRYIERLRPQDLLELSLVERIAEGSWRLIRLNRHEAEQENLRLNAEQHRAEILEVLSFLRDACPGEELPTGVVRNAARKLYGDAPPDPFGSARQKVELSISRAMKELRTLQSPARSADLPHSPYLEIQPDECIEHDDQSECDQSEMSQNPQNEPTADASPATSDPNTTNANCAERTEPDRVGPDRAAIPQNEAGPAPSDPLDPTKLGGAPPSE